MSEIGYALSSEEHPPNVLVQNAQRAEAAGFGFAVISDHFHPWTDRQGQSPFVWSVIGAIAHTTSRLRLGTGVTCPTMRMHPAIVAQAAATAAAMMPGRFFLGVGAGENLNEHILGEGWPPPRVRLEMLEEAIGVIRRLWRGGFQSHDGASFVVDDARIYTLPDTPPAIMVAAGKSKALRLAGRAGDGLISVSPERKVLDEFVAAGGAGKPTIGQVKVCWAADEGDARRTALAYWPTAALRGDLNQELPLPRHVEQATRLAREEDVAERVLCSPDPARHVAKIGEFVDAGFTHVYVHQVGPDQEGFLRFYAREVLPHFTPSHVMPFDGDGGSPAGE